MERIEKIKNTAKKIRSHNKTKINIKRTSKRKSRKLSQRIVREITSERCCRILVISRIRA
jgi:cell division ATPase FtsA